MKEERKEVIAYSDISGCRPSANYKSINNNSKEFFSNGDEIILSTTPGYGGNQVVAADMNQSYTCTPAVLSTEIKAVKTDGASRI